jgi:serine/threonine-protein kinase
LFIALRVTAALEYAHRARGEGGSPMEIVHSDISPQNILISHEGDVKLTDFGIAKAASRAASENKNVLRGKLFYMSPEQASGEHVDHRSDLFSLGAVLYEMITGAKPLVGSSEATILESVREARIAPPESLNPRIPEKLAKTVMKALERAPDDRYQDAAEMGRALERCLEGHGPGVAEMTRFMQLLFDGASEIPAEPEAAAVPASAAIPTSTDVAFEEEDLDLDLPAEAPDERRPAQAPSETQPMARPAAASPPPRPTTREISLPSLESVAADAPGSSLKRIFKKLFR